MTRKKRNIESYVYYLREGFTLEESMALETISQMFNAKIFSPESKVSPDFDKGYLTALEELKEEITADYPYVNGLTSYVGAVAEIKKLEVKDG